jgi:hypothetical protein
MRFQPTRVGVRFRRGKSCIIAGTPVNIGPWVLQKAVAKMKGKRAIRSAGAGFGRVESLGWLDDTEKWRVSAGNGVVDKIPLALIGSGRAERAAG